ncbi:hypothetical protein ACWDU9_29990 [Streptomyces cellulosae]
MDIKPRETGPATYVADPVALFIETQAAGEVQQQASAGCRLEERSRHHRAG